jgi:uncharacterized repeat protein (TIGR01451 family)
VLCSPSISKIDVPDPVLTGNVLTYTLTYQNGGPAQATNVVITDVVPLSTTYQTCTPAAICSQSGGLVTWTLSSLAANTSGQLKLGVIVDSDLETGDIITNDDYGIKSDQTDFAAPAGQPASTVMRRSSMSILLSMPTAMACTTAVTARWAASP